jgi:alpha-glucoside transport system substrate-binding protein
MRTSTRWSAGLAAVASLALIAAACSSGSETSSPGSDTVSASGAPDLSGQTVEVAATWTSAEQRNFEKVLDLFEQQTGATTQFVSTGDDIAAYLGPKIEGGKPPDVAILPQPGVLASFAREGDLTPIEDFAGTLVDENYAPGAREVGTVDGKLYAVWFRAAQKSTVWYNTHVFDDAGVEPPTTWDELVTTAQTISDSGVPPYSIGVDVGWPMSDLFENIYLRTAGPEKYDQLARHEIPWTDQSVKDALAKMADVVGNSDDIAGGTQGALQTDFNGSVDQMFADPPAGAMLFEGNFVAGVITGETKAKVGTDADFFDFPSIDGSPPAVMGGGDLAVLLDDTPAGEELIKFLATPEAAEVWAGLGGYISPNKNVDISAYTDPVDQRIAQALIDAGDSVRYDLSDLQPTEFGATTGQGIWGILTDFVNDPSDVDGTAQKLEAAAKAAYKQQG